MDQVLITGGTGFIGTRLCEVMMLTRRWRPRVFVHSTASATRIARFPIDFVLGDVCDPESVSRAVQDCSSVVHLASGDQKVMRTGLQNVLRAALKHGCSPVIHLSSVAMYGKNSRSEIVTEAAPAWGAADNNGREKLWQEQQVQSFARRHGLPFVILRVPNVYGAFSRFTQDLIRRIQGGNMPILDGGGNPCNLVYIDNLVEAILLSLWKSAALGEIFIVTDRDVISWNRCLVDHAAWVGATLPRVDRHELISPTRERVILDSLKVLPRVLLSGDARSLLRRIPLIKLMEDILSKGFESLPSKMQQKLRFALKDHLSFSRNGGGSTQFFANDPIIAAQARRGVPSCEKAQHLLGYSAPVSYSDGMALTEAWLRSARMLQ